METLLEQYRHFAIVHAECTQEGDSNGANVAHDDLVDIASKLLNSAEAAILLSLLDDEEPWIQLWAATHSLEVDEPKATAKLQELAAAGIPLASMSARYTLESWSNGELQALRK